MKSKMTSDGRLVFTCPGCDEQHVIPVRTGDEHPSWIFNDDFDKPTVTPSVLTTYRHPKGHSNDNPAPVGFDGEYVNEICHLFLTDGVLHYLSDCTHSLAGQNVPLPDLYTPACVIEK